VVVVRCTRKLLDRLGHGRRCDVSSTTALDDWYATILFTKPRHVVLLVNATTRLPVVIAARDLSTLPRRFAEGLSDMMATLQIPAELIAAEQREIRDVTFTTTASRSVLGTMNDYAIYIEAVFRDDVTVSLHTLSVKLADTPVGPLGYDQPRDVVRRLLEKSAEIREAG
jgi:hypothetical protein